tara:strand:- start:115 stop:303 length:189 start_codon:yes stop_codon:yes gene_type:complete
MYCVSKEETPNHWVKQSYFHNEFKAWVCARKKSRAEMCTYKVVDEATNEVTSIVRYGKGLVG